MGEGSENLLPRDLRGHDFLDHGRGRRRDRALLDLGRQPEWRRKAVGDELAKLLASNSVVEVKYPDWLANPVLVEKKKDDRKRPLFGACISITHT